MGNHELKQVIQVKQVPMTSLLVCLTKAILPYDMSLRLHASCVLTLNCFEAFKRTKQNVLRDV